MSLIQEHPPESLDEEVRDYLQRRFNDIAAALSRPSKFPERKEMPYKPQIGDVHYFGDPATHNYDAAITEEGFWGLTATGWELISRPFNGWRDITSEVKVRGTGPTDPSWVQVGATPFYAFNFSVGDKCWHSFHIPHDYIKGTDIHIHTHWFPDGTDANSVKWRFTYAYAHGHNQQAFNFAGTIIEAEQVVGGTQYQHYVTETAAINIPNMEPDGIIEVAVERITNGGINNANGIFLMTNDIHYQSNSLGTLNRAPDFYA